MIVVAVLITSCQVSRVGNSRIDGAQIRMSSTQKEKNQARDTKPSTAVANRSNSVRVGLISDGIVAAWSGRAIGLTASRSRGPMVARPPVRAVSAACREVPPQDCGFHDRSSGRSGHSPQFDHENSDLGDSGCAWARWAVEWGWNMGSGPALVGAGPDTVTSVQQPGSLKLAIRVCQPFPSGAEAAPSTV